MCRTISGDCLRKKMYFARNISHSTITAHHHLLNHILVGRNFWFRDVKMPLFQCVIPDEGDSSFFFYFEELWNVNFAI